jgi:hypothetical protein
MGNTDSCVLAGSEARKIGVLLTLDSSDTEDAKERSRQQQQAIPPTSSVAMPSSSVEDHVHCTGHSTRRNAPNGSSPPALRNSWTSTDGGSRSPRRRPRSASTGEASYPGTHARMTSNTSEQSGRPDHSPLLRQESASIVRRNNSILRSFRRKSGKAVHKTSHAVLGFWKAFESFLFPHNALHDLERSAAVPQRVRGGVMLADCTTIQEHYARLRKMMEAIQPLHGAEGLAVVGLEYRVVYCAEHKSPPLFPAGVTESPGRIEEHGDYRDDDNDDHDEPILENGVELPAFRGHLPPVTSTPDLLASELTSSVRSNASVGSLSDSVLDNFPLDVPVPVADSKHCHLCMRRLYHVATNTVIDESNRQKYIPDGDFYDRVALCCQEYAHDVMCAEAGLEWVTIEDGSEQREPIRALVNTTHPLIHTSENAHTWSGRPTMLIATGRGKVRAGIFSRQHLMCTSLESSTALPIVREAVTRRMNVVMIDPNAHGDRFGYDVFRKSMSRLFAYWEGTESPLTTATGPSTSLDAAYHCNECAGDVPLDNQDLYILSHSASGGQLARFLLDKSEAYLPHIRAIAFTDSTHNIQWARKAAQDNVVDLLQGPECVYFKCANENRDGNNWYLHATGEEIPTDSFWKHRFGDIKTYWAGTNEHSLTNWYAHKKIWEHFDRFLRDKLISGVFLGVPAIIEEATPSLSALAESHTHGEATEES